MQVQCWSTVNNAGTTLSHHWFIAMCLLYVPVQCNSFVAYVPDINTMLGWFLVAHSTHTMYVNSTLVYRRPV